MQEKRINWKQIMLTAIVTGIVTVATGMLLYYFQIREPRLVYFVEDTLPFESPSKNFAIYHVKIENDGNKIVKNVVCQLSYSPASIEQYRIKAEPSITYQDSILGSSYRVEFPSLNPHESVVVSILASSSEELASRPKVSLRGEGITGVEASKKTEKPRNEWLMMIPALIAAYAGVLSIFITRRRRFQRLFAFLGPLHGDDQREVLSYLCGIHGLSREVDRYLNMFSEASYWSESDRFAMLAIENPSGGDTEKRKKVLKDLLTYAQIASSSKGIIHYNIARIAKVQGDSEECDNHLNEAKRLIPKLIQTRLKLDPVFRHKE